MTWGGGGKLDGDFNVCGFFFWVMERLGINVDVRKKLDFNFMDKFLSQCTKRLAMGHMKNITFWISFIHPRGFLGHLSNIFWHLKKISIKYGFCG